MDIRAIKYTALKTLAHMSEKKLHILYDNLTDWTKIFDIGPSGWEEFILFKGDELSLLKEEYSKLNLSAIQNKLEEHELTTIFLGDEEYPPLLAEIENPPFCLYIKGQFDWDKPCLAMVGSRAASQYGKKVARQLAAQLAACGFVIVSGLAKGIDSQAHWGALDEGSSYGILAFGHDFLYPKENKQLAERLIEQGALISEYPYFIQPYPGHFPARNRIISGLSLGTIVVEAKGTSGSLITAGLAGEQSREVFAVPGNIFSENSRGCHELIKQGAKLVEGLEDILDEFQYLNLSSALNNNSFQEDIELSLMQQKILQVLQFEPIHVDILLLDLNLSMGVLLAELTQMEILGLVKGHPGGYYSI